jgi:hypothetical protein
MKLDFTSKIPSAARYWMPTQEQLNGEEGIGFFRDVWTIVPVTYAEAAEVVAAEAEGMRGVDAASSDAESYEMFAKAMDQHNPDDYDPDDEEDFAELASRADIESIDLRGLEIGVSGLAHALAAIGCVPVASCRGHVKMRPWSRRPVVFAAVDRAHAEWLRPLVRDCSCGFAIDTERPDFLVIGGPSILETAALAAAILDKAASDPPPPLILRPTRDDEEEDDTEDEVLAQDDAVDDEWAPHPPSEGQLSPFD